MQRDRKRKREEREASPREVVTGLLLLSDRRRLSHCMSLPTTDLCFENLNYRKQRSVILFGFPLLELIIKASHSLAGDGKKAYLSLPFGPVILACMNRPFKTFSRPLILKSFALHETHFQVG